MTATLTNLPAASDGLLTLTTLLQTEPLMTLKIYPFGVLLNKRTPYGNVEYLIDPAQLALQLATTIRLDTGILSPNTIYVAQEGVQHLIVEYRPRKKTAIFLEGSDAAVVIPMPELLLIRRTTDPQRPDYRVFAVKQCPADLNVPLFQVPLPNIYSDGRVCWGTVPQLSLQQLQGTDLTEDWKVLLGTRFGSHSVTQKSKSHPSDIRQKYFEMEAKKSRVYPKGDLIPANRTLGQMLEDLT